MAYIEVVSSQCTFCNDFLQGGFDAGDDTNYCSFLLSRSEGSTAWTQMSNIGINGRMVLRMGNGYDNSVCEPLRG